MNYSGAVRLARPHADKVTLIDGQSSSVFIPAGPGPERRRCHSSGSIFAKSIVSQKDSRPAPPTVSGIVYADPAGISLWEAKKSV